MNWLYKIGIHYWEIISQTIDFSYGIVLFYRYRKDKVCIRCGKYKDDYTRYMEKLGNEWKEKQKRKARKKRIS